MEARVGPAAREAIFAQLADAGRAEQVAQRLTDAIVLGVLAPAERLPSEPELAKRFGVALITVREGLGILREAGLVETRRGREGGSFVMSGGPHGSLLDARLHALAQVELADMAAYFSTILSGCAERAALRATERDGERLLDWVANADFSTPASARSATGGFYLELAVLSQSARLVREQIRIQAEFGPLLLLGLDTAETRTDVARLNAALAAAVAAGDPALAGSLVGEQLDVLAHRLLAAKAHVERGGSLDERAADHVA